MRTLSTLGLSFLAICSLAGVAAGATHGITSSSSFQKSHLRVSSTRELRSRKSLPDDKSAAAYVIAGSGLMSLGLLFGHIRQRPGVRIH
jgi:hypothetical protein